MTLMGEALIKIANKIGCSLKRELKKQIYDFWDKHETEIISEESSGIGAEAGIEARPGFLNILNFFASVKTDLKYNETQRDTHRKKIINRSKIRRQTTYFDF